MVIICDKPYSAVEDKYLELYSQFKGLNLSSFQKWAVKAIADGDNVLGKDTSCRVRHKALYKAKQESDICITNQGSFQPEAL